MFVDYWTLSQLKHWFVFLSITATPQSVHFSSSLTCALMLPLQLHRNWQESWLIWRLQVSVTYSHCSCRVRQR